MAKLNSEQKSTANFIELILETVLSEIKIDKVPVMARYLNVNEDFFSIDEAKKRSPQLKKLVGTIEINNLPYDIWQICEINWYKPGKLYVGLYVTDQNGDRAYA